MSDRKNTKPSSGRENVRTSITLIALIVLGAAILFLLQVKDDTSINLPGQARLGNGVPAPDFSLPALDGQRVRLSDYRGKVVLFNVWATWCLPCVEEMPSMERLHQTMSGEDFKILAVSIDASGAEAVRAFMKQHSLNFTALSDPQNTIGSLYQTTGIPESFIIDRNGTIVAKVIGPRDWAAADTVGFLQELARKD